VKNPLVLLQTAYTSYPRASFAFILASLVNSVGSALMWPLTTIYVHNVLHKSYGEAGFVLFCQSLASVVGQFVGGALFHRVGARRLIVWSLVLTGFAQLSLVFAKEWFIYILAMSVNGLLIAITMPAVNAFIGFRWYEHRYRLFNAVYVSNNVGVAIGTTIAGLLAAISFDLTFLFNGISTLAFALFFYLFLKRLGGGDTSEWSTGMMTQPQGARPVALLRDVRLYVFVGLGALMVFLSTSTWNSGVAPFLNQAGFSPAIYSGLWTVNGILILVGQPLTSMLNRFIMKTLPARLVGSALFYSFAFAFLYFFHASYADFIFGMVLGTLGEMLMSPTIPSLITQTTGQAAPFYLGVVGSIGSFGRLIGPVLFGTLFDHHGLAPILIVATGTSVLGAWMFGVHVIANRRFAQAHHLSKEARDGIELS